MTTSVQVPPPSPVADAGVSPIVLHAEALLPGVVVSAAAGPTLFHREARKLLDELGGSLVTVAQLEPRLRILATLAAVTGRSFRCAAVSCDASDRASLAPEGLRPPEVLERIRYDRFFAVRRVPTLDPAAAAGSLFAVIAATLDDVADAHVGLHELLALLGGMVEATAWVEHDDARAGQIVRDAPELVLAAPTPPIRRFVLGHHLFALMADFARHHIRAVALEPTADTAATALLSAAHYVRASTAAMWYSVSYPPAMYRDVVRPAMDAASTADHGFSGGDNFDFRRLRESWEELHDVLVQRWSELEPETRDAARLLFEGLVLDNERHTGLASEMVGTLPSLNADRHARRLAVHAVSAVAALRMNTDDRRALLDKLV